MNLFSKKTGLVVLTFCITFCGGLFSLGAQASGFEKGLTWSGKNTGVANAVVSSVSNSESLYFNPAGLGFMESDFDLSLNFSPTFSQFEGPLNNGGSGALAQNTSDRSFSPIMGSTVGYKPSSKFGVGAGFFVSGGSKANYSAIDFSQVSAVLVYKPRASTELALTELSVGAAFKVMPKLSIGASWRIAFVSAELWEPSVNTGTGVITETAFKDLSDTNAGSFRIGTQYKDDSWGIGAVVRTPISFKAEGTLGVRTIAPGTTTVVNQAAFGDGTAASIESTFPLQVEIGSHFNLGTNNKILLVYGYTKYSSNDFLTQNVVSGTVKTALNWNDQHHFRLGYEHENFFGKMPLKVGYMLATPAVPSRFAKITFSSPGLGHAFAVGSGYAFANGIEADFAVEYALANGSDKYSASGVFGDYNSNAYAFHTGVNYKF